MLASLLLSTTLTTADTLQGFKCAESMFVSGGIPSISGVAEVMEIIITPLSAALNHKTTS